MQTFFQNGDEQINGAGIPDKGTVLGIPAMPDKQTKRQWIAAQQLPEMIRRLRELEKEVEQLKAKVSG